MLQTICHNSRRKFTGTISVSLALMRLDVRSWSSTGSDWMGSYMVSTGRGSSWVNNVFGISSISLSASCIWIVPSLGFELDSFAFVVELESICRVPASLSLIVLLAITRDWRSSYGTSGIGWSSLTSWTWTFARASWDYRSAYCFCC